MYPGSFINLIFLRKTTSFNGYYIITFKNSQERFLISQRIAAPACHSLPLLQIPFSHSRNERKQTLLGLLSFVLASRTEKDISFIIHLLQEILHPLG